MRWNEVEGRRMQDSRERETENICGWKQRRKKRVKWVKHCSLSTNLYNTLSNYLSWMRRRKEGKGEREKNGKKLKKWRKVYRFLFFFLPPGPIRNNCTDDGYFIQVVVLKEMREAKKERFTWWLDPEREIVPKGSIKAREREREHPFLQVTLSHIFPALLWSFAQMILSPVPNNTTSLCCAMNQWEFKESKDRERER